MIKFEVIKSQELENHISIFDEKISFIKSEFNIELKTYGNIIRIALNALQPETIETLIERVEINKELERALDNVGGYTIKYLGDNNPKSGLINLLNFLKENFFKKQSLFNHLQKNNKKEVLIADINDIDFIKKFNRNSKADIIPFLALKRAETAGKTIIFYSFNGQKDFDFAYNQNFDILFIIYEQEYQLYQKQLANRKANIESELMSIDRLKICNIPYVALSNSPINISGTIESIVNRLDDWNTSAYDGYKNECDLLLTEIEEKIIYKLTTSNGIIHLEINDTIFNNSGNLERVNKIKIGDKIRIYPKEQLAENLYQVAVETEPDIFGKVEENSETWKKAINDLRRKYGTEVLYKKLKERGLRILPATLEIYGKGIRKFPMFNNDLRAIFKFSYPEKNETEINSILKPILKSKTTYNSTMIALGRGLKQELRLFLKENRIGEILEKRNFNANTLNTFIEEFMPLQTIISKEAINFDMEYSNAEHLFQEIEL